MIFTAPDQEDLLDFYLKDRSDLRYGRNDRLRTVSLDMTRMLTSSAQGLAGKTIPDSFFANAEFVVNARRKKDILVGDYEMMANARMPTDIVEALRKASVDASAKFDVAFGHYKSDADIADVIKSGNSGIWAQRASSAMMMLPDFTIIDRYYSKKYMRFVTYVKLGSTAYSITSRQPGLDPQMPMVWPGDAVANWLHAKERGANPEIVRKFMSAALTLYPKETTK